MINEVNFTGRLDARPIICRVNIDSERLSNIEKLFAQKTKGTHYETIVDLAESQLFLSTEKLSTLRKKNYISPFPPRQILLTKEDTISILSRSDEEIAEVLANCQKFVSKFDKTAKKMDATMNKARAYIHKLFEGNGIDAKKTEKFLRSTSTYDLTISTMTPIIKQFCKENNLSEDKFVRFVELYA